MNNDPNHHSAHNSMYYVMSLINSKNPLIAKKFFENLMTSV